MSATTTALSARTSTPGTLFTRISIPLAIIALLVIGALISPSFLTVSNLVNVLNANAAVGLVALGMTFVAVCGGLADLSVPANVAMGALVTLGAQPAVGPFGAALLGLVVATVGGIINGILIGYLRINPIIATLGTGSVLLGLSQLLIGGGIVYGEPSALSDFVKGSFLGLPIFVWIFVIVALILTPLLSRTAFGRWNFAVGGNYQAAEASAVPVRFTKASAFVLTGFLAGLCGVLLALSNGQARPIIGTGYEFVAITAVVIGGTSLFGGSGSVLRTIGGVVITALIGNLIILGGLPTQSTGLVTGAIVLVAVGVDVYFRRKAGRE
ncbi:ABC transporter permease [Agromyces silvae]|uniref:ABC transporter permease n=1 Tax=Agromyces silvae TaxID=3388266 RepID=UPI00280BD004|nr:ABC transporter permease [Agromyces protaetiae]